MFGWLVDCQIFGWLIDWLIECLVDWLIDWSSVWLIDWLIDRMFGWLIDWQFDWLVDWLIECLVDWLIDRMFGWLIDWSNVRLIYWLIDWSIGWLVSWVIEWCSCCSSSYWTTATSLNDSIERLIDWLIMEYRISGWNRCSERVFLSSQTIITLLFRRYGKCKFTTTLVNFIKTYCPYLAHSCFRVGCRFHVIKWRTFHFQ